MIVTSTSVAFILLGLGLGFCGWWFLGALRRSGEFKSDKKIGALISFFFFAYAIHSLVLGLATLFAFTSSNYAYLACIIIANILITGLAILGSYIIFYIFFPKIKRIHVTLYSLVLCIGISAIAVSFIENPQPLVTINESFDFNHSPLLSSLIWFLAFVSIGAPLYIFGRLFLFTNNKELKLLSGTIATLASLGVVNISVRLLQFLPLPSLFRDKFFDIGAAVVGIIFAASLFFLSFSRNKVS